MCAPHSGPVATVRDGSRSAAASAGRHRHRSTGVLPRCGGSRGRGGRPAGYPRRRGGLSRPAGHVPSSSDGSSRGSPRRPSMAATSARSSGVMWASAGPMGGGVGQVRAGQVAEPGEVTRAGRIIGRVRGHGRHPAVSSSSPVENGRRDRAGERARVGGGGGGDRHQPPWASWSAGRDGIPPWTFLSGKIEPGGSARGCRGSATSLAKGAGLPVNADEVVGSGGARDDEAWRQERPGQFRGGTP